MNRRVALAKVFEANISRLFQKGRWGIPVFNLHEKLENRKRYNREKKNRQNRELPVVAGECAVLEDKSLEKSSLCDLY